MLVRLTKEQLEYLKELVREFPANDAEFEEDPFKPSTNSVIFQQDLLEALSTPVEE